MISIGSTTVNMRWTTPDRRRLGVALKSSELIEFLQQDPEAMIRFEADKHYGNECTVSMMDFEYDTKRKVFVLPNLCLCLPEPD